ncbi:MAG: nickel-dependent hydrogenase large subunit [Candidatus Geothermincolia bacterium]
MSDRIDIAGTADIGGQKVRLYPVTRIEGRGDIEVLFTPDQSVVEARFRALEFRGMESLVRGFPVLRTPQVLSRTCGTCGPFHQLASCMAIEAACGTEVAPEAAAFRELVCWLLLTASHLATIAYLALPDFALPMSDAAVKNITGIYMIDQESVTRLSNALTTVNEAINCLAGNYFRPAVIVPGGVSSLPDAEAVEKATGLLAACEDDLRETMRLAEMLTRRESRMGETGTPLSGYYMASTVAGCPAVVGEGISVAPFAGGDAVTMDTEGFITGAEERPVPWSFVVPLAVRGFEPAMVGPLARMNLGYGEDTPTAEMECRRVVEQWEHPLVGEFFFLVALACEAIWGWEKARNLMDAGVAAGAKPCAPVQVTAGDGSAVVDSPRGIIAHTVSIDEAGRVGSYRIMSPLQFNYLLMNDHLTGVATKNVRGIEIGDAVAARLQLAVRSFNPCVPCGTH